MDARTADASPRTTWLRRAAPLVLLAAVTLAAYANAIPNGFVWDDETIIVKNPDTRDLSRIGKVLLSPDETAPYYRPLNRASYLVDYQLFGMDPRGFHAVSVAIHAAAVLALYAFARRLLAARAPALVAALLLAVHPIGVEAVSFVTTRNNPLALLFALLALTLFVDAERRDDVGRAWLSGLAFFLGLLSKEPAAMALPLMLAWVLLPGLRSRTPGLRSLRLLAPHGLALAVYLVMRTVSLGAPVAAYTGNKALASGLLDRLALNWYAIPRYLGWVLFPRDLAIYHVVPERPAAVWWLGIAWVAIAAGVVLLVRRRTVGSTVGLLWFGLNLLPIAGLVSIPTATAIAERYFYIPAVGLWLLAGDGVDRLWRRPTLRPALAAATALVAVVLGARSVARNSDWADDLTLARSAVAVEPRAPMARYNLGLALEERGDHAGARAQWEEALRLEPAHPYALAGLGTLAARAGRLDEAEAYLRAALRSDPDLGEAHLNLGKLHDERGDRAAARQEWEAVLRKDPEHAGALLQLGTLDAVEGDLASAERRFRVALRADPDLPEALFNLGKLCEQTGRPAEALGFYTRFLVSRAGTGEADAVRIAQDRIRILRAAGATGEAAR